MRPAHPVVTTGRALVSGLACLSEIFTVQRAFHVSYAVTRVKKVSEKFTLDSMRFFEFAKNSLKNNELG